MASTPPKRNYGPMAGAKKKMRPRFAPASRPKGGLGSAYNSEVDPRGPDAYVPVPDSRGATQRRGRKQSGMSKPNIDGRYGAGSQFLSYKIGSNAEAPKPKKKMKSRRKVGDAYLG